MLNGCYLYWRNRRDKRRRREFKIESGKKREPELNTQMMLTMTKEMRETDTKETEMRKEKDAENEYAHQMEMAEQSMNYA